MSRRRGKAAPEGWEMIESTIEELNAKMKEATNETHEGKRRVETTWPVFQIHHQRSRYIYELYFKRSVISKELYDYCIREKIADANLIAKWKKQGYEKLCCLRCIQAKDNNYGTNCICRVPKVSLDDEKKVIQCNNCGCRGEFSCFLKFFF